MKAILLVGGMGTRLRPLTLEQPKALLPVLNRPFLSYQLDLLESAGVTDVVLAAGRNSKPWEKALRELQTRRLKFHFAYESRPLGTGGAVRFAADLMRRRKLLGIEDVLVLNGDVFFDVDIKALVRFHSHHQSLCTLALTHVNDPSRFGVVKLGHESRVLGFVEKPAHPVGSKWVNAGVYLLNTHWIFALPQKRSVSIERESFPASLRRGEPMFGFRTRGYWNDIGTHATYLTAHRHLLEQASSGRAKVVKGSGSRVGSNVTFEGFVCIGRSVRVGNSCFLRNSVVLDRAVIGNGVRIDGAVIGPEVTVGDHCVLQEGTVLGRKTKLSSYSRC